MRTLADFIAADDNIAPVFRRLFANPKADPLSERHERIAPRRFAAQPVTTTGFGPLEEPEPTPLERAAQDYQDSRELQDREDRHFGRDE